MHRSSDQWKEMIQSFQKNLNHNETLNRLREISTQMLDQEMFEHAAVCHQEMAKIYKKMKNPIAERENWLKSAADLYASAYKQRKRLSVTVDSHFLIEMEACYLRALENCGKNGCIHLSAMITLELALRLMEFDNFVSAFEYFQKAALFFRGDVYKQKIILDNMCACVRRVENFDDALYDTTLLFTNLTKADIFMSPIRERLVEVELKLILLHLEQYLSDGQERPKSLLSVYSSQQTSKPSVMVREEFLSARNFITAFKQRDLLKLHSIFHKELYCRMDMFSRQLAQELITKISSHIPTTIQSEFKEILEDQTIDETERRKRMFEWYQISSRKELFETL